MVDDRPHADDSKATRARARVQRDRGQWAMGSTTPRTEIETVKRDGDGMAVRSRIVERYSRGGFASIDPADLRRRFRWWGLYPQRRQGLDSTWTRSMKPADLEDPFFMLRIRVDGGRLSGTQLAAVSSVSKEFARDTADLTSRQSIQLHWVRIEDVPAIWHRLDAVGLTTLEAGGDAPRVVLGSPVAGVAADEIIDGTPAVDEVTLRALANPAFSNLPRKLKTAVSGSPRLDIAHETNCLSFVGVNHPDQGAGFDVWIGGGLSTDAHFAKRLGAWVPSREVADVWLAVAAAYRDYGYRAPRNRARLKYLIADWGPHRFRSVLQADYLGRRLLDGPAPAPPAEVHRDHVGVNRQRDGRWYIGASPVGGRVSGTILGEVARLASRLGTDRIRLTPEQHLLLLDVAEPSVPEAVAGLESAGLSARASAFRRGTRSCPGIEFCKLGIVETKARAASMVAELEKRRPEFSGPLSISINGCPFSCVHFQTADIGLRGFLMHEAMGKRAQAFQVSLGGTLGIRPHVGRKIAHHRVPATSVADYVDRLLGKYLSGRDPRESFATWVRRTEESDLR